eukprot:712648-Pelagomonas_calceolata.AAC.1
MLLASGAGLQRKWRARVGAGRKIWCRSVPRNRCGREGVQRCPSMGLHNSVLTSGKRGALAGMLDSMIRA